MAARRTPAAESAESDLARKLRWEGRLVRRIEALNRETVDAFVDTLATRGVVLGTPAIEEAMRSLLLDHRMGVSADFSERLRRFMPEGVAITPAEEALISSALSDWNEERAALQAGRISRTTAANMQRAVLLADEATALEGVRLTPRDRARSAGVFLGRTLQGRAGGIATLETQDPAEAAKLTEAEVLNGTEPTVRSGRSLEDGLIKRWDSQGDSIVRQSHLDADGQLVPTEEPFIVGGFQLMWPGDSSLGAPLSETARCRCASHFDPDAIIEARRGRMAA